MCLTEDAITDSDGSRFRYISFFCQPPRKTRDQVSPGSETTVLSLGRDVMVSAKPAKER